MELELPRDTLGLGEAQETPMPKDIDLPLDETEEARVPQLAREYQSLGGHAGTTEEKIARMIFEGGIFKNKDRPKAAPLPAPAKLAPRTVTASDSSLRELEELEARWGLSREEVLRIVVVDGLAYVEEALHMFKRGHKFVPDKAKA